MKRDFQAFKNRTAVTKEERLRQRKNCAAIDKDRASPSNDNFLITVRFFGSFPLLFTVWFAVTKEVIQMDINSLAHTKWNCKYHVVFAPKYRRKVFYNEKKEAIREIIRTLCQWKGVEIIEGEVCPDHIHLLLSIPPKMSVSGFMGYLKGKSSLMIFQRFGNMKFAYRNREFWCKGYYVDTVGKNTAAIKSYIANQLKQDKEMDQISLFDPRDPFTGSK